MTNALRITGKLRVERDVKLVLVTQLDLLMSSVMSTLVNANANKDSVDVNVMNAKPTSGEIQMKNAYLATATITAPQPPNAIAPQDNVSVIKEWEATNATNALVATLATLLTVVLAENVSTTGT